MSIIEELYKNEKENYEKRKKHLVNKFQALFRQNQMVSFLVVAA